MYYGMKPSSGNDICGCDICWKARYDGTPGGAGVVQTGKIWRMWVGKLIKQVGYGICYRYVKYGGWISVGFVCKIKYLSGVVVFSINNSSLIGNICLYPLCVVNKFKWDWFTSVYIIYKLKIQETPLPLRLPFTFSSDWYLNTYSDSSGYHPYTIWQWLVSSGPSFVTRPLRHANAIANGSVVHPVHSGVSPYPFKPKRTENPNYSVKEKRRT